MNSELFFSSKQLLSFYFLFYNVLTMLLIFVLLAPLFLTHYILWFIQHIFLSNVSLIIKISFQSEINILLLYSLSQLLRDEMKFFFRCYRSNQSFRNQMNATERKKHNFLSQETISIFCRIFLLKWKFLIYYTLSKEKQLIKYTFHVRE